MRIATTSSSLLCHNSSLHQSLKRLLSEYSTFTSLSINCKPLLLLLLLLLNSWTLHTLRLVGKISFQVRAAWIGGEACVAPNLKHLVSSNFELFYGDD